MVTQRVQGVGRHGSGRFTRGRQSVHAHPPRPARVRPSWVRDWDGGDVGTLVSYDPRHVTLAGRVFDHQYRSWPEPTPLTIRDLHLDLARKEEDELTTGCRVEITIPTCRTGQEDHALRRRRVGHRNGRCWRGVIGEIEIDLAIPEMGSPRRVSVDPDVLQWLGYRNTARWRLSLHGREEDRIADDENRGNEER